MNEILRFLVAHMSFLWDRAKFRVEDSAVSTSNGGDAMLVLSSDSVRLRLVRDRGQLLLDAQPRDTATPGEWYSVDLLRRLVLGTVESTGVMGPSYARFLQEHMADLEQRFSPQGWDATQSELKELKRRRAKELFG